MRRLPFLLLLALAACGPLAPAPEGVTLRFWAMGREGEVVAELVRDFEAENPGVRVRVQQIPWSAAHEKLITAHVGNAAPDVAQLGNTWVSEFLALNAIVPLDERIAASQVVAPEEYFPGIWKTNRVNGGIYGVPWYVDTRLIFYRTDLLQAAGYEEVPTTWAGWREAMEAVKRQVGPDRYAIFLPTNEWAQPVILGLQAGSPLLREDHQFGAFSEPRFRQAFDFYLDLFRSGLAPTLGNQQVANVYQEFERGLFAMYITGPWNLGEFRRRLPAGMQDRWATAPLPGPEGEASGVSIAGGASLVLFRTSRHPEEAWRLIEFLSRPEQQLRFFRLTGSLPARTAAWQDTALVGNPQARAFWEQLQRVEPLPPVPEWEQIATMVINHAEQAIRGGMPPERALAELDRSVDRALEKRRWLLAREEERQAERGTGAGAGGGR